MVADETSKAFRASIGRLRDHEVKLLHRWALQHCALCAVLCGSKGSVVLVALKDSARAAASFARTVRTAMRTLGIPTSTLAGHWCHLTTEQECLALCTGSPQAVGTTLAPGDGKKTSKPNAERARQNDDNVRIVSLP